MSSLHLFVAEMLKFVAEILQFKNLDVKLKSSVVLNIRFS